jgi:adenine-specific DNA-methyltransferase|tara:strand:+ start:1317 stop:3155 length:1839 start_codon:yes stop_codon:yes gene_type:complete
VPKKIDYTKYSKEELIAEITELKKRKKYGLVWEEKREPEKVVTQCKNELPVLKEIKSKAIKNDPDKPTHILIEGDNYHALSVLNYTHQNAIDVIFIDPPYNLGGDFIYNDKYVDKEDSYRHSKWLTFMKKRLELAKSVLKETGAIFITIDDNEASHLKVLCDEVFQPTNFIAQISWQKKFSPQNDAKYFSDMHDFILVYAKKKQSGNNGDTGFTLFGLDRTEEMNARYSNPDNDPRGDWTSSDLTAKRVTPKDIYPITTPNGKGIMPVKGRSWSVSKERLKVLLSENRIWFGDDGNNMPRLKRFLSDIEEGVTPVTWWTHQEVGHNQEARQELKKILYDVENVFDTPKPVRLMKRIIQLATQANNNSIVLDFFAGSGTTAQAVLEMNDNDGGNRQFIMATNNENNICEDSTYPRIQRVIEGYEFEGKEKELLFEEKLNLTKLRKADEINTDYLIARENNKDVYDELKGEFKENTLKLFGVKKYDGFKDGLGGNLKYFKTTFVPAKTTDRNKEKLTKQSLEMLCLKEATFESVIDSENIKIFKNNDHYTGILLGEEEIPNFKEQIKDFELPVNVYVFSLGDDDFAEEFSDLKDKVKVSSIPSAILRVYKRIFR